MTVIIPGVFPGLNEYIKASKQIRGRWNGGNAMKHRDQGIIATYLPRWRTEKPVRLHYRYYLPNAKRDLDNISGYFHKVFQDALVERGIIPNDGMKYIKGFSDDFRIDRGNPRIEIDITEA